MSKLKVFCFGFGQVAESFVNKLIYEKKAFDLSITSRKETHQIQYNNLKINSYQFTYSKIDPSIIEKLEDANYILISFPPVDGKDIVVDYFESNLKNIKNCNWVTYLSATSVYGDHKGDWVNERSITKPTSKNGTDRLYAEKAWKSLSTKINFPLQIFRLAGIYSHEFNILKRLKSGKAQIVNKKNHFFSRIHVEDIANILYKSIEAYTGLIAANEKFKINQSNVNLLDRQVETDRIRLERGQITLSDVAQSESSLAEAQAKLIQAESNLLIGLLNYKNVIGEISDPELLSKSSIIEIDLPSTLETAIELSKKNNPDLKISEFEYQQSKKDTSNAKSDLAPTATLSFDKSKTEDLSATYDEREKDVLKATVTWPFYSGGKNIATLKKNQSLELQKSLLLDF